MLRDGPVAERRVRREPELPRLPVRLAARRRVLRARARPRRPRGGVGRVAPLGAGGDRARTGRAPRRCSRCSRAARRRRATRCCRRATRSTARSSSEDPVDPWPNFQIDGYGMWLWSLEQHLAGRAPDADAAAHGRARRRATSRRRGGCRAGAAGRSSTAASTRRRSASACAGLDVGGAADRRRRRSQTRPSAFARELRSRYVTGGYVGAVAGRRARRLEHPVARRSVRGLRGRRPARRRDRRRGEAPARSARAAASTATAATPTTAAASGCCSPRRSPGTRASPAARSRRASCARWVRAQARDERRPAGAGDGRVAVRRRGRAVARALGAGRDAAPLVARDVPHLRGGRR